MNNATEITTAQQFRALKQIPILDKAISLKSYFREPSESSDSLSERSMAISNILRAANLIRKHQSKILERQNLSEARLGVLRILKRHCHHGVSMNLIKEEIENKTSDISRIIERMVNIGFVHYAANGVDKRMRSIIITAKGINAVVELDNRANEMLLPETALSKQDAGQINLGLEKMLRSPSHF